VDNDDIATLDDLILLLSKRYSLDLAMRLDKGLNVIIQKDSDMPLLATKERFRLIRLGEENTVTFFYPFKGG
jgi:hypothetical protein